MFRKILSVLVLTALFAGNAWTAPKIKKPKKQHETAFAIFVDAVTYDKVGKSVDAYRKSVEKDGLSTYIVIDDWKTPDDVRQVILDLAAQQPPLEGVVFVGDIPVAMLRDAQHLTSAFKMDQENPKRFERVESSVPSDRFYDDFDLKFKYLGQDSVHTFAHYYTLLADSPQRIVRDIYSARIKPPVDDDTKYEVIEKYLLRVVEQKKEQNVLDNIFTFAGHGYHSESLSAWESYLLTLRDMFPDFYRPGGGVMKNLYHTMNTELKEIVLTELQDPALDIALFHAHGAEDTQYLLGSPPINSLRQNVDAAKEFLRSKLRAAKRRGKSLAETKLYFMENYGVPLEWFEGTFGDSLIAVDSLADWKMDIHIEDIQKISPQAEFMVFDECYNGRFVTAPYVAGAYVFGNGTTVAGMANSVNVLQDIWVGEYLGLLAQGVRIGLWHQNRNYLETHIIGDPTYHFSAKTDLNLNQLMAQKDAAVSTWETLLTHELPAIRMLAVAKVFQAKGADFESELVDIYHNDFSSSVRLEVIKCLAELRSPVFEDLLKETLVDPAEIIRRMTIGLMGDVGYDEYLPIMAKQMIMDPSDRINFKGKGAITKIDPVKGLTVCEEYIDSMPAVASKSVMKKGLAHSFSSSQRWLEDGLLAKIADDSLKMKKRISSVRTFRNYRFHQAVPTLIEMAEDTTMDAKLRSTIIEALGWFSYSYNRNLISDACAKLAVDSDQPEMVRNEALKTQNRLLTGPNNTLTP